MNTFDTILVAGETKLWSGVVNRAALATTYIIIALIVLGMSGFLFMQDTIRYTSQGGAGEMSGAFLAFVMLGIGALIVIIGFLSDFVREYIFTEKRIIMKSGIIGTDFKSIYYEQIKNLEVDVGLIGKIFGVGTIKIDTGKTETYSTGSGRGETTQIRTRTMYDLLKHIDAPYEVYQNVQAILNSRKENLYSGNVAQRTVQ